jgi:hypothetical protein
VPVSVSRSPGQPVAVPSFQNSTIRATEPPLVRSSLAPSLDCVNSLRSEPIPNLVRVVVNPVEEEKPTDPN